MIKRSLSHLAAAAALGLSLSAAQAGSPQPDVLRAELLSGWETRDGAQMAGLRLTLAPGWKTYWRAPGDAGIPPVFDWTGSGNLQSVVMHWPRPKIFEQNGMRTIGYEHEVVLPLELTPRDPGAPMSLHGEIQLGVCEDICMPMQLEISAELPGMPQPGPIRSALADTPMGANEASVGSVICQIEPLSDGLRLTTDIKMPPLAGAEIAVVELPDPAIWVSEAQMTRQGGTLRAVADLVPESAAPFALDRSSVRFTILGADVAVDIRGCEGG